MITKVSKIMSIATFIALSSSACVAQMIKIVSGDECVSHMPMLSKLRLDTFKEYPYLYVGNEETETMYTGHYCNSQETMFALAYEDYESQTEFAGILTGLSLTSMCQNDPKTQEACEAAGLEIPAYYYFGEVITLKQFRNRGIATNLFKLLEERAKTMGYKRACFITSEREADHPLRPQDYKGPNSLWLRLGYTKTDMRITYVWPTQQANGTVEMEANVVAVWSKDL